MRGDVEECKMRVFAISGYSGTGKTTLVEEIIKSLVASGHTVATVKSSKHGAGPDQGTDTWRHLQAGSSMTIFLGPTPEQLSFKNRIGPDDLSELSKYDYLIVEGLKSVNIPRFWCVGDAELIPDDIPVNTWGIVAWSDRAALPGLNLPVFNSDEIDKLVEIVKKRSVEISEIE
jgi:molybdopterin-guanine dinucleotide biosynthesis protein B